MKTVAEKCGRKLYHKSSFDLEETEFVVLLSRVETHSKKGSHNECRTKRLTTDNECGNLIFNATIKNSQSQNSRSMNIDVSFNAIHTLLHCKKRGRISVESAAQKMG